MQPKSYKEINLQADKHINQQINKYQKQRLEEISVR